MPVCQREPIAACVQVIGELDEKKREALHASWVKVNRDFGSIFTSLLPGTMAKLEPPEGQTFLAGLEVKARLLPLVHAALPDSTLLMWPPWCLQALMHNVLTMACVLCCALQAPAGHGLSRGLMWSPLVQS